MTTNANLRPNMLIEYRGAHEMATAWVLAEPVPAKTDDLVKIRVRGESGINTDLEFDIYVKRTGRAKVIEGADLAAKTERKARAAKPAADIPTHDAGPYREPNTGRVATSHADCTHEKSKAARAACRKARAVANA